MPTGIEVVYYVTKHQKTLITEYFQYPNHVGYELNGMDQTNQEAFQDLVDKGLAFLVSGFYKPAKKAFAYYLQGRLQIEENSSELKRKKLGDKEYIIVVRETVRRTRHYHVWAQDADEAEEKMTEGPLNVIFKESSPADEKIVVDAYDIIETILPVDDYGGKLP